MRQLIVFSLLCCALLVRAETPATAPQTEQERLQSWWDDLEKSDPQASRALLNFSTVPDTAVAFFKERLVALRISEEDLNKAIADLGSDDEAVWKPAFEKLEYLDPRITIDLPTLMNTVTEPAARSRLVAVLCDDPADRFEGKNVELRETGHGNYNFFEGVAGNGTSYWAEAKVEQLGLTTDKRKWTRAVRAIVLLQHIGTPDAIAILKEMAGGHPDASPTKAAVEALTALGIDKDK